MKKGEKTYEIGTGQNRADVKGFWREGQITSRYDGVIKKLHYETDDVVQVGQVSPLEEGS